MRYLPNGGQMKLGDRCTIEEMGVPSMVLMERAALGVLSVLEKAAVDTSRTLVVCGSGNNGGDGFAVARLLRLKGCDAEVWFVGKDASMSAETRQQRIIAENYGVPVVREAPEKDYTAVVDAVFGIGLTRTVEGTYYETIERMNRMRGTKIAVDIPSGVSADDGSVLGIGFRADITVTFAFEKLGMLFAPGLACLGRLHVVPIGIEPRVYDGSREVCYTYDREDVCAKMPPRRMDSHKGSYGKVLLIMGSAGMAGAAFLSAKAAYTVGAGLVRIYTPEENRAVLQQLLPEAVITTYRGYEEETLQSLLDWADVVGIGSGLSTGGTAERLLSYTVRHVRIPCIIDADGLNLLARHPELLGALDEKFVLTPHLGEMSRLCGISVQELRSRRLEHFREFTGRVGAVCVMKDARTLSGSGESAVFVNTSGCQAMAKGGSGDVLGGVIAGLLAQKLEPERAAALGVFLHGLAGEAAAEKKGDYSVLAGEIADSLSDVLRDVSKNNKRCEHEGL